MGKLPQAEKAIIDVEKLCEYLLSPSHPVGRFKAVFFEKYGYNAETWQSLQQSLRKLILTQDVHEVIETKYGEKYIVEGFIEGKTGGSVKIVTVWVILKGETVPRFVTAYPGGM